MTSEEGEGVDHMLVAVEVGQFGRFAQSEGDPSWGAFVHHLALPDP